MGTLIGSIKERIVNSSIGQVFLEINQAISDLLADYDPDMTVQEAVEETGKTSPENISELEIIGQIYAKNEEVLNEMAENQFDYSNSFGDIEPIKDEDGYNALENKLSGIEAEVSEKDAIEDKNKTGEKAGRQKTRVDED